MSATKDSVYIRKKKLSNGNVSLYLDIYSNGVRKYEFLKMYLIPENSRKSVQQNKETLRLAENARMQKLLDIQKNPLNPNRSKTNLIRFIELCMSRKKYGTSCIYKSMLQIAKSYFSKDFNIEDITDDDVSGFFGFVGTIENKNRPGKRLSSTTQHLYCSLFKAILRCAADEKLISYDVGKCVKNPKRDDRSRQYLSVEEVQRLANTRLVKTYRRAFLFSCFTGLRESDITNLEWRNVVEQDGFTRIIFCQKKTDSVEYLDISPLARKLMGDRKDDTDKVFPKFHCTSSTNRTIRKWLKSVGIDKGDKFSFHCARHTFAVMMLTLDVDIYTTSKLLGHKKLETTLIYAKIVDKKKQEAVTKIPIII